MDIKKIMPIIVVVLIAIVVIVGIIFLGNSKKETVGIAVYTGRTSKSFDNKLIKDSKEMRKFVREISMESASKNYESFNLLETFNEDYFKTKKVAVISIYEDDASVYEYQVNDVKYNEDKTIATIDFTNIKSGYSGSMTTSWINAMIIELEGTVTSINFNEITE